jgi:hypothetical protein
MEGDIPTWKFRIEFKHGQRTRTTLDREVTCKHLGTAMGRILSRGSLKNKIYFPRVSRTLDIHIHVEKLT